MVLTLLVVNKSSRMLSRLNKITDACLSLQRTVLIFVYEKNWSIHLVPALSGNQTPSQQEHNRTSPQEERRPKLLLLLVLKNKATLLGERRSQVTAPKAHLHPKCLCTEGHRARGVERAMSQSWYQGPFHVTRQAQLPLALRLPCCSEGSGTRAQVPTQWSYLAEGQMEAVPRRHCFLLSTLPVTITSLSERAIFLWAWNAHLKTTVNFQYETRDVLINVFLFLWGQTSTVRKTAKLP